MQSTVFEVIVGMLIALAIVGTVVSGIAVFAARAGRNAENREREPGASRLSDSSLRPACPSVRS